MAAADPPPCMALTPIMRGRTTGGLMARVGEAAGGGGVQGRPAQLIRPVHVGAAANKQFDHLDVAPLRRHLPVRPKPVPVAVVKGLG